jgi:hypothetical protein
VHFLKLAGMLRMLDEKNNVVALISIGIFTCVLFGLPVFFLNINNEDVHLLKEVGIKTQGTVIEKQCSNHHAIRYSFKVANQEHYGKGTLCTIEICHDANIGDPVVVYYLEKNPDISRCGSLDVARGNFFNVYIMVIFFGILFFSYMFWLIKKSL